jgi:hypothetical protein
MIQYLRMQYVWLVYFILSLIFIFYGLVQLIGMGWAIFIFDLFSHSVQSDYTQYQREHPPIKEKRARVVGLICLLVGIFFGYLGYRNL